MSYYASFKSTETKDTYTTHLRLSLNNSKLQPDELVDLARTNPRKIESLLLEYVMKRRAENIASTLPIAMLAVKWLLEMNDVPEAQINWKKINRMIPEKRHFAADRPPRPTRWPRDSNVWVGFGQVYVFTTSVENFVEGLRRIDLELWSRAQGGFTGKLFTNYVRIWNEDELGYRNSEALRLPRD